MRTPPSYPWNPSKTPLSSPSKAWRPLSFSSLISHHPQNPSIACLFLHFLSFNKATSSVIGSHYDHHHKHHWSSMLPFIFLATSLTLAVALFGSLPMYLTFSLQINFTSNSCQLTPRWITIKRKKMDMEEKCQWKDNKLNNKNEIDEECAQEWDEGEKGFKNEGEF